MLPQAIVLLVTAVITMTGLNAVTRKPQVLSWSTEIVPTVTLAVTATPTVTPVPTLIPTPTPKPTLIPTPTIKPATKYKSEEIYGFTNSFAGQYGVDANVIRRIAICESGFNPASQNGIYAGMFQFDAPTWKSFRLMMNKNPDPDLRYDAKEAVETVAYMLSIHREALWPNCRPK
jgi:hypothetical protein